MGKYSRDYCDFKVAMTSYLASVVILALMITVINAVTDSEVGRTFVLNPNYQTWEKANQSCHEINGTLATIDQLYVIPDMGYTDTWTLWVGLRISSSDMRWEDGTAVSWSNWYSPFDWTEGREPACVSAVTSAPYAWLVKPCNETLPSVCEVPGGICRFEVTYYATLRAYNDKMILKDLASCLQDCRTMRDMDCRSVEKHRSSDVCQLSRDTRWTQPEEFQLHYPQWDYYHWTCVNGTYLGGVYVSPNGADLPSTTEPTTEASTQPTTQPDTTVEATTEETVCVKVRPPTENETEEIQEEVKQLQTLTTVYKEQNRMKKKTSRPDTRGSAATVGSLAVGLVVTVFLLIFISDVISFPQHIRQMNKRGAPCGRWYRRLKKRKRKKQVENTIHFTEYSENGGGGHQVGPLVVSARVPHNYRPAGLAKDDHVENTYSNGHVDGSRTPQVNRKVELHLERIRRLENEFGGSKMAASCPDLDSYGTHSPDAQTGSSLHGDNANSTASVENSEASVENPEISVENSEINVENSEMGGENYSVSEDFCMNIRNSERSVEESSSEGLRAEHTDVENYDGHVILVNSGHEDSPHSQSPIRGFSTSDLPQFESRLGARKYTSWLNALKQQNAQVPVLNTTEYIELSSFRQRLHNHNNISAKAHRPLRVPGSENIYVQDDLDFETQSCEMESESGVEDMRKERNGTPVASEVDDRTVQSLRPHVEIWIEEDNTPMSDVNSPCPVDVDKGLLQVRDCHHSPKALKKNCPNGNSNQAWS